MKLRRLGAIGWLLCLTACGLFLVRSYASGRLAVETDILKLLPKEEVGPALESALASFSAQAGGRLLFLLGAPGWESTVSAAREFARTLERTGRFDEVRADHTGRLEGFRRFYFPYRYALLSPDVRSAINDDDVGQLLDGSRQLLSSPMPFAAGESLAADPLLLFPRFLTSLAPSGFAAGLRDGYLTAEVEGKSYILVSAASKDSPFSLRGQDAVLAALEECFGRVKAAQPDLDIKFSGVVRYAAAGARAMRREASLIGWGSAAGSALLMLCSFRAFRHVLLSLLPMLCGFVAASAVSLLAFPKLHLITISFGTSLIGVCADYAIEYFSQHRFGHPWDSEAAMRRVTPSLFLGALTTVVGYLALGINAFPGLRQIALFSSAGVAASFITVLLWFPYFLRREGSSAPSRLASVARAAFGSPERAARSRKVLSFVALAVLAVTLPGLPKLSPKDDIRLLQALPAELLDEERRIWSALGGVDKGRFIVVESGDEQSLVERLERLSEALSPGAAGPSFRFTSMSDFLPSRKRQQADYALLRSFIIRHRGAIEAYLDEYGFPDAARASLFSAPQPPPLAVSTWLADPVSEGLRSLWLGEQGGAYASIVLLSGMGAGGDPGPAVAQVPGAHFIDTVSRISSLMARYRTQATSMVGLAYVVVYAVLAAGYGLRGAAFILAPSIIAAVGALGAVGHVSGTFNFFNVLALLLVVGVGVDYAIFFADRRLAAPVTLFASVLCAASTQLSFGLLALSETPLLHHFGLTLLLGVGAAVLFAPLGALASAGPPARGKAALLSVVVCLTGCSYLYPRLFDIRPPRIEMGLPEPLEAVPRTEGLFNLTIISKGREFTSLVQLEGGGDVLTAVVLTPLGARVLTFEGRAGKIVVQRNIPVELPLEPLPLYQAILRVVKSGEASTSDDGVETRLEKTE